MKHNLIADVVMKPRWFLKIAWENFVVNNSRCFFRTNCKRPKTKIFTCKLCAWVIFIILFTRLLSQGPEEMCLSLEHQNPLKTSEKMGYFDRVTVSLHSIDRKPRDWGLFVPRSPFGHPSGDVPCASKDMACGYWFSKVDLGQIRSEEIVYSRFIKIPLG